MSVGKIRIATCLILITSILLLPRSLVAQTSTAPINDWSRLAAVESGSKLSLKLKNGKKVGGKLSGFTDSALSLSIKNKTVEVKREEVRRIHQVQRKSATTSTLIGVGVGAGAAAAAGALVRANDNDAGFDFDKAENLIHAGMVVIGAGVGGITGFFVGRARRKRVLIYESNQP
jgi:hypothetical protein